MQRFLHCKYRQFLTLTNYKFKTRLFIIIKTVVISVSTRHNPNILSLFLMKTTPKVKSTIICSNKHNQLFVFNIKIDFKRPNYPYNFQRQHGSYAVESNCPAASIKRWIPSHPDPKPIAFQFKILLLKENGTFSSSEEWKKNWENIAFNRFIKWWCWYLS